MVVVDVDVVVRHPRKCRRVAPRFDQERLQPVPHNAKRAWDLFDCHPAIRLVGHAPKCGIHRRDVYTTRVGRDPDWTRNLDRLRLKLDALETGELAAKGGFLTGPERAHHVNALRHASRALAIGNTPRTALCFAPSAPHDAVADRQ